MADESHGSVTELIPSDSAIVNGSNSLHVNPRLTWVAESKIVDRLTPTLCNRLDFSTISMYVTQRSILSQQQMEELRLPSLTKTAKNEKFLEFLKTSCDTPATALLSLLRQVHKEEGFMALEDPIYQLNAQLEGLPEVIEELKQQELFPARQRRAILPSFSDSTYQSMEAMPTFDLHFNVTPESLRHFATMPRLRQRRQHENHPDYHELEDKPFHNDDSSEASTTASVDDETLQVMQAYSCFCNEVAQNLNEVTNIKLVRLYLRNELSPNRVPKIYNISSTDQEQVFSKKNDIYDVFEQLSKHTSWIDYQLITGLSRSLGKERGITLANKYEANLCQYVRKRAKMTSESREIVQVKLDWEWDEQQSPKQAKKFTLTFSRLLECHRSSLVIKSVSEGCVLITWSVPKELCYLIAYYCTMYSEFMNLLGVKWIKILGKPYTIKDYIPSLGVSSRMKAINYDAIQRRANSLCDITERNPALYSYTSVERSSISSLPVKLRSIDRSNYFQKRENSSLTLTSASSKTLPQSHETDSSVGISISLPELDIDASSTHSSILLHTSSWLQKQDSNPSQNPNNSNKNEKEPGKFNKFSSEQCHAQLFQERSGNNIQKLHVPVSVYPADRNQVDSYLTGSMSSGFCTMSRHSSDASDFNTLQRKVSKTIRFYTKTSTAKQFKDVVDKKMKEEMVAEWARASSSLSVIHDNGFTDSCTDLPPFPQNSLQFASKEFQDSYSQKPSHVTLTFGSSTNIDPLNNSIADPSKSTIPDPLVNPPAMHHSISSSECSHDEGYSTLDTSHANHVWTHTSFSGLILSQSSETMPANLFMIVKQDYKNENLQLRKGQIVKAIFQDENHIHIQTRGGQCGSLPSNLCHLSLRYLKDMSKIATISKAYTKPQLQLGQPLLKDIAISSYRAVTNTELSVTAGAKLSVLLYDDDWVYCVTFDGRAGFIPRPHCLILGQQVSSSLESDSIVPQSSKQSSSISSQNQTLPARSRKDYSSFSRLVLSKATPQSPANLIMTCTSDNQARRRDEITISKGQKVKALLRKGTRLLVCSADQQGYVSERMCFLSSQYTRSSKQPTIFSRWIFRQSKPTIGYSNIQYKAKDKLELSVQRNQPLNVLFSNNTWAYVVTQKRQSGFLPRSIVMISKKKPKQKSLYIRKDMFLNSKSALRAGEKVYEELKMEHLVYVTTRDRRRVVVPVSACQSEEATGLTNRDSLSNLTSLDTIGSLSLDCVHETTV